MDDTNPLQYLVQNEEQKNQLAAVIKDGNSTAAGLRQLLNTFYRQSTSAEYVNKTGIKPDPKRYLIWKEVTGYKDKELIYLIADYLEHIETIEDIDVIKVDPDPQYQKDIKTVIVRRRNLMSIEKANQQVRAVVQEYGKLHKAYTESRQTNNYLTERCHNFEEELVELEAERSMLDQTARNYTMELIHTIDASSTQINKLRIKHTRALKKNKEETKIYKEANEGIMDEISVYEQLIKAAERDHVKTKRKLEEVLETNKDAKKINQNRILHVMNDFASNGGVGTVVASLERNLNLNGYDSDVLLSHADENGKFGFERIKKEGIFDEFMYHLNFLEQELSQYDIIHIHSIPSFRILEAIDSLKNKGKCPKIVNTCHSSVKKELAAHLEITEDNYDIAFLKIMINDGMLNNPFRFVDTFWGSAIFRQEKIMSLADKVQHMCSAYLNQTVEEYQAQINANKHIVVYNGVEIIPESDITPMPKKKRILYSGRFAKEKGFDKLVEALPEILAAHPDAEVVLMGGDKQGELVAAYKAKVRTIFQEKCGNEQAQKQLEKIQFTGWITNKEEMRKQYQLSDFLLVPSIDESFSLVTAEALNHQRIPIITNTSSLHELYLSNGAGIGIDHDKRNKEGIAEIVNFVLDNINEQWIDTMAKTGRELVKKRYSLEDSIHEQIKVYQELLKN